jgi:hypothetical protein
MGAALHLAHAHQIPPGPKRKRGGGGGSGDGYDALVTRIWRDGRHTPESRELLLLLAWLISRDPDRFDTDGSRINTWARADKILGTQGSGYNKRQRVAILVHGDRPRYESSHGFGHGCQAPMIRRAGECGKPGTTSTHRVDPVTGWRTLVWSCARHDQWGREQHALMMAAPKVEPIPNRGGLMPSYLKLKTGDAGWIGVYENAAQVCRTTWEPPKEYGITADDWPTPGKDRVPSPPRLHLAALDGELLTNL